MDRVGRVSGVLWLASLSSVVISLVIALAFDITLGGSIERTLASVAAAPAAHIVGLAFDELAQIAILAAVVPTFLVFRRQGAALAGTGAVLLAAGALVFIVHNMGNFTLAWIAADYVRASGAEATVLRTIAEAVVLTAKWGVTLGGALLAIGLAPISWLLLRRGLSPALGVLGLVAAAAGLVAAPLGRIDPGLEQVGYALWLPFLLWQIGLASWLLGRGDHTAAADAFGPARAA